MPRSDSSVIVFNAFGLVHCKIDKRALRPELPPAVARVLRGQVLVWSASTCSTFTLGLHRIASHCIRRQIFIRVAIDPWRQLPNKQCQIFRPTRVDISTVCPSHRYRRRRPLRHWKRRLRRRLRALIPPPIASTSNSIKHNTPIHHHTLLRLRLHHLGVMRLLRVNLRNLSCPVPMVKDAS